MIFFFTPSKNKSPSDLGHMISKQINQELCIGDSTKSEVSPDEPRK